MSEGTPKAIEPKGIVRNATKIGVQDGQAEDMINLRFMDGSWRASGDGRLVHTMSGTIYEQLYVHTNVYHHLLGVKITNQDEKKGTLYWFADIADDGVTFTPRTPVALTDVKGDIWVSQTGHLLTVIDETDEFKYFVYKLGNGEYAKVITDANGQPDSRKVFPYGGVHFNLQTGMEHRDYNVQDDNQYVDMNYDSINYNDSPSCVPKSDEGTTHAAAQVWHSKMLEAFNKAIEDNSFVSPFLVLVAIRLYDGSYVYASNPVLINPREKLSMDGLTYTPHGLCVGEEGTSIGIDTKYIAFSGSTIDSYPEHLPVFSSGASSSKSYGYPDQRNNLLAKVTGQDLLLHIDDIDIIRNNKEVFYGLSVFVTRQSPLFYMGASDYTKGSVVCNEVVNHIIPGYDTTVTIGNVSYKPGRRTKSEIINDLLNSPFYLLRDYTVDELSSLQEHNLVDIRSDAKYKGLLSNITSQKTLQTESTSRVTYLPQTSYMYNGRVHIANYKTYPFFGFPIDSFHLHNHSLWPQTGTLWKNVLSNVTGNFDTYWQYPHSDLNFIQINNNTGRPLIESGAPYYVIRVVIESQQGEQEVVRYIPAYDVSAAPAHTANFIEDLNPILSYPDARAKRMKISYIRNIYGNAYCLVGRKDYPLKPHPYLNIAYYIDPNLKPLGIDAHYDEVYVDF